MSLMDAVNELRRREEEGPWIAFIEYQELEERMRNLVAEYQQLEAKLKSALELVAMKDRVIGRYRCWLMNCKGAFEGMFSAGYERNPGRFQPEEIAQQAVRDIEQVLNATKGGDEPCATPEHYRASAAPAIHGTATQTAQSTVASNAAPTSDPKAAAFAATHRLEMANIARWIADSHEVVAENEDFAACANSLRAYARVMRVFEEKVREEAR